VHVKGEKGLLRNMVDDTRISQRVSGELYPVTF
jgi:hypothetical protein